MLQSILISCFGALGSTSTGQTRKLMFVNILSVMYRIFQSLTSLLSKRFTCFVMLCVVYNNICINALVYALEACGSSS